MISEFKLDQMNLYKTNKRTVIVHYSRHGEPELDS